MGTLFRITPQGQFTLLHSFGAPGDGTSPSEPLVQANDGSLYGTTYSGSNGHGTIFRLIPGGALTVLHRFSQVNRGPTSGLTQGRDGYLYGTNANGFGQGRLNQFAKRLCALPGRRPIR